jgi:hypothetical protein
MAVCVMLTISCKEEVVPTPYTYTKVFTGEVSKTWKLKYIEETLNGSMVQRFVDACFTDDRYTFHANPEKLYVVTSGSRKCGDEATTIPSTWGFTNATATLSIVIPILSSSTLPFFVREIDDNDMELEIFLNEEGTESYRIYFELTDEQ